MRSPIILFDLGNVLVHLDLVRGLGHLRRLAGPRAPADLQGAEVFFGAPSLACNQGLLSPEDFLAALARQLELPFPDAAKSVRAAWCDIFTPWPEMESLAADVLAAGHRAYLASNTDPIHFAFLRERMPVLDRLDACFLSYEARLLKPDPEFFRALLARYQLVASECLFLDDRPDNVAAAASVGIRAEVHTGDVSRARAFLRDAGVEIE